MNVPDLSADRGLAPISDVLEDMCVSLAMQAWQHHLDALQARHAFETGLAGLRKRLAEASKIIEQQGALIDDLRIELACRMEPNASVIALRDELRTLRGTR